VIRAMMRNDPIKHVFIWPAVLVVLAISIFPLIYSLTTSFLSYRLIPPIPPRVVWFGNYVSLLQEPRFWNAIFTTTLIAFIAVGLQYTIGFAVAVCTENPIRVDDVTESPKLAE
jgi:multiple sugar transport system permease protein